MIFSGSSAIASPNQDFKPIDDVSANGPRVLILGDEASAEMVPVRETLSTANPVPEIKWVRSVPAATAEADWDPDLVIVCQHWPGEFPQADVGTLFGLLPLARWVCCLGPWCESDGRNHSHWPPAVRVPARWAGERIRRELKVTSGAQPPLPLTANREEIYAFDHRCRQWRADKSLAVRLITPDQALRDWLADCLSAAGHRLCPSGCDPPEVVLWDLDPWREETLAEISAFCRAHPAIPVIGWMAFAYADDVRRLQAHGVRMVLTKLAPERHILDALESAANG